MEAEINGIFRQLVKELIELLPDFGENLGIDSKAIPTHAKTHQESKPDDGRRDNDADYGVKTYRGQMEQSEPALLERCKYFTADRGYDDGKLILKLRDCYSIKPIIDIRNMWKDGDSTRLLTGQTNFVGEFTDERIRMQVHPMPRSHAHCCMPSICQQLVQSRCRSRKRFCFED